MEQGSFFAPLQDGHPVANAHIELCFHLPDGLRVDLEGIVATATPHQGMTINIHRQHPGLAAMRSAVERPGFIEQLHAEPGPGTQPLVTFADPTKTIPADGAAALKRQIRQALEAARSRTRTRDD